MQMGYEYSSKSVSANDHAAAVIDFDNHVALSNVISARAVSALNANAPNFFA
jgi:hypothetical protein